MFLRIAEVLQTMISEDGHIAVLRGPTHEYSELISLCRADGVAVSNLSREMFDELVNAGFVKQDSRENESELTIFKLTYYGREVTEAPREEYLKAKLIGLGYPWPEHLETKSIDWLEAEIRVITPVA
jgi:hypothetical protein